MARRDRDADHEEDEGFANVLLGGKPQLKDLTDPRKRKQALKVARMLGFEIRREQLMRIGIAAAIVLVVLLIGLWAIAKVLGLLFWGVIAVAAGVALFKLFGPKPAARKEVTRTEPRPLESDDKAIRAWNDEAERRADRALEELERKLKE
jgi:hypothetical protein